MQHIYHLRAYRMECFLNVYVLLSTRLKKLAIVGLRKGWALLDRDFPGIFLQVAFVSDYYFADIFIRVLFDLFYPVFYVLKWLSVDDWVHQDNSVSPLIICSSNVSESILTSSIPNCHFEFFISHLQDFNFKIDAYCCRMNGSEILFSESEQKNWFSNVWIPHYNKFDDVVVIYRTHKKKSLLSICRN